MDPERWRVLEGLFHEALGLPDAERRACLERAMREDAELGAELAALLAADAAPDDLVERLPLLPPVPDDPLVGRVVGAYRLVARIAAGGMGVVYRAERADGLYERAVAVKLVRGEALQAYALRRFDAERRTLAALDHPNVARLYDGGTTPEGTPYLVMELVDGPPIDRWCAERGLGVRERLALFVAVCRAVHFAHENLVVHGDLKPPNVLVDPAGAVKLLDFGIARLLAAGEGAAAERTLTLARHLTPEYASPEQWRGEPLTPASDVYSLGVLLHVLLTGTKPLSCAGLTAGEWERELTQREPMRPSTRVGRRADGTPAVPFADGCGTTPARLARVLRGDLDRVVLMALRKDPARRYPSALALAEDVERHLAGRPVTARSSSFAYRALAFARRNKVAVGAIALVVVGQSIALHFTTRAEGRARREATHARIEADSFRRIAELDLEALLAVGEVDAAARRATLVATLDEQAARVRRVHAGERHLLANLLDALGVACSRAGTDEGRARAWIEEARALREEEFGPESLEVALSLRSLAEHEERGGRMDRAAELLAHALALHRGSAGVHRDADGAALRLGRVLARLGRHGEARALLEEALAARAARDARSLDVAEVRMALAELARSQGDVGEAQRQLEEAHSIRRARLGPDTPGSGDGAPVLPTGTPERP